MAEEKEAGGISGNGRGPSTPEVRKPGEVTTSFSTKTAKITITTPSKQGLGEITGRTHQVETDGNGGEVVRTETEYRPTGKEGHGLYKGIEVEYTTEAIKARIDEGLRLMMERRQGEEIVPEDMEAEAGTSLVKSVFAAIEEAGIKLGDLANDIDKQLDSSSFIRDYKAWRISLKEENHGLGFLEWREKQKKKEK
jgi:hypothetical protein